jgi:hypothetical protein
MLCPASGSLCGGYLLPDLNEVSSLAYSCAHVNFRLFPCPMLCCAGVFIVYSVPFCVPSRGRRVETLGWKAGWLALVPAKFLVYNIYI